MEELKPCPFCGKLPQLISEKLISSVEFNSAYPNNGRNTFVKNDWWSVECICCRQLKYYRTESEAITTWNTRVNI